VVADLPYADSAHSTFPRGQDHELVDLVGERFAVLDLKDNVVFVLLFPIGSFQWLNKRRKPGPEYLNL
jgi:hypothetical protein